MSSAELQFHLEMLPCLTGTDKAPTNSTDQPIPEPNQGDGRSPTPPPLPRFLDNELADGDCEDTLSPAPIPMPPPQPFMVPVNLTPPVAKEAEADEAVYSAEEAKIPGQRKKRRFVVLPPGYSHCVPPRRRPMRDFSSSSDEDIF
jgi:hypothetical protein